MIAVVVEFQLVVTFFFGKIVGLGQWLYLCIEIVVDLLFRDTADFRIAFIHRYICQIIEIAEDAHLREFGDTSEERELNIGSHWFLYTIKCFQRGAIVFH